MSSCLSCNESFYFHINIQSHTRLLPYCIFFCYDSTLLWNFFMVGMACPPSPISVCFTSRAQSIFKQAMCGSLILFHVVSASMKRQYELFLAQSELSPPQINRVRFSQGSQHSGDRSSLVGRSIAGSGPQLGFNNMYVVFLNIPYVLTSKYNVKANMATISVLSKQFY